MRGLPSQESGAEWILDGKASGGGEPAGEQLEEGPEADVPRSLLNHLHLGPLASRTVT